MMLISSDKVSGFSLSWIFPVYFAGTGTARNFAAGTILYVLYVTVSLQESVHNTASIQLSDSFDSSKRKRVSLYSQRHDLEVTQIWLFKAIYVI